MRARDCILSLGLAAMASAAPAATVYAVVGTDTSSVFATDGSHLSTNFANEIDMGEMALDGVYPTIMSEAWRMDHLDSAGEPMVFTWWMLTGGWHQWATNVDSVAATRVFQDHWGEQAAQWGDEIALHFHHFAWNGSAWVQAPTFAETLWDFEWGISQLVLDCDIFPVGFRSGWNYMDNPYQQELERWIPYRMEAGGWLAQDIPYHPSFSNYRSPGTMRGWEARHRYISPGSMNQGVIDQIFTWADQGEDQLTALWSHQYENGFVNQQLENLHTYLTDADARFPDVDFRYVTSQEGMRLFQGSSDVTPPPLDLTLEGNGLRIESEPDIYQINQPWVAARRTDDEHIRLDATPDGPGVWRVAMIPPDVDEVAVAVSDLMGNAAIRRLDRGSRRWSTQTELSRAERVSIEALAAPGIATLATGAFTPLLEQTESDESAGPIQRSYWIGQTFVPTQPGITAIDVGIKVNVAPATIRVEHRSTDGEGLPDMSLSGLLASGEGSIGVTGDLHIPLTFGGLVLDGRQYALVFLREAGDFEVMLHQAGSSPNGNLVRAYSLDWIHIPAFDCRFATYDQDGVIDQSQLTSNSDAFNHETGEFLAQTFTVSAEIIGAVEVMVDSATAGDTLSVQLRRVEPDGRPDLSPAGLLAQAGQSVPGAGPLRLEVDWAIPSELHGEPLALLFLSPQAGQSSVQLAHAAADLLPGGEMLQLRDTEVTSVGGDLWLRVEERSHATEGTLTFKHDAGRPVEWRDVIIDADLPAGTMVETRFAVAENEGALAAAPWSEWMPGTVIDLPAQEPAACIAIQVRLTTADGRATPTLEGVRVSWIDVLMLDSEQGFLLR